MLAKKQIFIELLYHFGRGVKNYIFPKLPHKFVHFSGDFLDASRLRFAGMVSNHSQHRVDKALIYYDLFCAMSLSNFRALGDEVTREGRDKR